MTTHTNRNNIKPMLLGVTVPMMVLLRRLWAIMTESRIRSGQFAGFDCILYGDHSFTMIRMASVEPFVRGLAFFALLIFLKCSTKSGFAFGGLVISFLRDFKLFSEAVFFISFFVNGPAFFGFIVTKYSFAMCYLAFFGFSIRLIVIASANLTFRLKPIFLRSIPGKFRNRFDFFASGTSFRYDLLRHGRLLLISDYCLEPLQTQYLCGSSYCSKKKGGVK